MAFLAEYSCWGLFFSSFLAATILPLSSEVVLAILLANGLNPYAAVSVATLGNLLGSVTNYGLGILGNRMLLNRYIKRSDREIKAALDRFKKFGAASLLFAWVPVIGDPLTMAAGLIRVNFLLFLLLVFTGKFLRYVMITLAVLSV
jgi:membrane protein YqaA with SNARE-associated domain